jgi:SAM-dependent methyltransferase
MRKLFAFALAAAAVAGLSLPPQGTLAQDKKEKLKVEASVIYVPTDEKVVTAMLKLASLKEGETMNDLGCGDGRLVIAAVKDFKAKKGLGVDYDPERMEDCKKSLAAAKLTPEQEKCITFKQGDIFKMTPEDFKDVDVVTLYLLPELNLKLRPVLQKGLKNGARIVSHDFDMGDWKPEKTEKVMGSTREHTIHLWTIGKKQ